MTDDKYINRLINWISIQPALGKTLKDVVTVDLEDFGKRIDALDDAGHKGAHAEVSQYEASRSITGAYLLIGDILNLWAEVISASAEVTGTATITATAITTVASDIFGNNENVAALDSHTQATQQTDNSPT
jgi:hypothetical protein